MPCKSVKLPAHDPKCGTPTRPKDATPITQNVVHLLEQKMPHPSPKMFTHPLPKRCHTHHPKCWYTHYPKNSTPPMVMVAPPHCSKCWHSSNSPMGTPPLPEILTLLQWHNGHTLSSQKEARLSTKDERIWKCFFFIDKNTKINCLQSNQQKFVSGILANIF